ncbi:hypothetical protein PRZ48_004118 [Zasmidium cellare]|uniref:NACHT domain-containing protein n=1 Tax=Zasmidium cellare TaxID=395010 RepID=A0ABR0EZB6_ZASCE|nr:hypothetical protein PRZ48_004118 [Zasmidium cellare]
MDPLTAFSLAANVIAIVEVTAKVVNTTWEVSTSGAKEEHIEIKAQAQIIQTSLAALKPALSDNGSHLSTDDQNLIALCKQSEVIAHQLLKALEKCEAKQDGKVTLENLWRGIKSEWNDTTIKTLRERLKTIDEQANRLISTRYSANIYLELQNLRRNFDHMSTGHGLELHALEQSIRELVKNQDGSSRRVMLKEAAEKGGEFALQAGILGQLWFEDIDRRIYELEQRPNHERSYLWLDDSATGAAKKMGQSPANFTSWLTSSDNLYWISGNPGTGKSTLMKFLYSNPETKSKLEVWAQGRELLMAPYFFWEVGRIALLRTQEGLLRTLLFQVLRQRPALIREVYQDLWPLLLGGASGGHSSLSNFAGSQVSLEVHELRRRMKILCERIAHTDHNCCLFLIVDGSDEYMGKSSEVIALTRELCECPNVKVCVSSRPENEFREAYGNLTWKLFMEDFNKEDIREYVHDTLESHPRFKDDDDRLTMGADLIKTVVDQSNGVFLWVRLVLEELGEGLTNRDTISKLQKRVLALPKDLGPYFDHMLDRVGEVYHEDSATMLMVTARAGNLLTPLTCWYISEGPQELDAKHEVAPADARRNIKRRKDIETRLRSFCRGLLVVRDFPLAADLVSLPSSSVFGQKVIFLHRSVREWLLLADVQRRLGDWKPAQFDVDELICKAVLAQVTTSPQDVKYFDQDGPVEALVQTFMFHLDNMFDGPRREALAVQLLDEMVDVLSYFQTINGHALHIPKKHDQAVAGADASPVAPDPSVQSASTSSKAKLKKFFHWK